MIWADAPQRHEAGSPNVVGAVALAAACRALLDLGMDTVAAHERALSARLWSALAGVPGLRRLTLWPDDVDRVGVATFNLDGYRHPLLAAILSAEHAIGVRHGCFCAHPLMTRLLGVPDAEVDRLAAELRAGRRPALPGAVRASLGLGTTPDDIDRLVDALHEIAATGPRSRYEHLADLDEYRPERSLEPGVICGHDGHGARDRADGRAARACGVRNSPSRSSGRGNGLSWSRSASSRSAMVARRRSARSRRCGCSRPRCSRRSQRSSLTRSAANACWPASASIRAATLGAAAAVLALDGPLATVCALMVLATIAQTLYRPTHSALLPALCAGPQELTSANLVRGLLDSLATLGGPLAAAVGLASAGPRGVRRVRGVLALGRTPRGRAALRTTATVGTPADRRPRVAGRVRAIAADRGLLLVTGADDRADVHPRQRSASCRSSSPCACWRPGRRGPAS